MYWVPIDGGKRMACLARGSVDKKERNEKVCSIPVAFPAGQQEEKEEKEEEVVPVPVPVPVTAAAAANGKPVVPEVTSPMSETFVDAPEAPLVSPAVPEFATAAAAAAAADADTPLAQDVQNLLSLRDADEKTGAADTAVAEKTAGPEAAVPNGKPVAAS